ncbi:hypothetical protein, conserved [Babesia ovata]|uniref:Uncharacterized protein n=1 Tax=Babesia ovata TaxID=189622 RepID=A0A2H6KA61_9APIC|nr:uncharacterized protein BOVATA_013660 [Babesia ovata]GBE59873.1 hypothetical protein, conserved [Babesia ovata]
MSKSLASFLDRRKKSTVKAATLLLQTEEAAKQKQKAKAGKEEPLPEQQSDHDDEWKVSDDEETKAIQKQATFSGSLLMSVRTVTGDGAEERGPRADAKPTQHVWQPITEPPVKEEPQPEKGAKVWIPKYKSVSFVGKDDIDLAEAARLAAAKSEHPAASKVKKVKQKPAPLQPQDDDEPARYVKVKFNVFSVVDEEYHTFKAPHPTSSVDSEKVKAKYIARAPFAQAA